MIRQAAAYAAAASIGSVVGTVAGTIFGIVIMTVISEKAKPNPPAVFNFSDPRQPEDSVNGS